MKLVTVTYASIQTAPSATYLQEAVLTSRVVSRVDLSWRVSSVSGACDVVQPEPSPPASAAPPQSSDLCQQEQKI